MARTDIHRIAFSHYQKTAGLITDLVPPAIRYAQIPTSIHAFQYILLIALSSIVLQPAHSDISFEETTLKSAINYTGSSWSGGWRDYNNDGYVDLWVSNHGGKPTLYVNSGDGSFSNGQAILGNSAIRDGHGVAWADIDNNGYADLIEIVGAALGTGEGSNQLFINDGIKLKENAQAAGLSYPAGRGRVPLWLDYDLDGLLDILIMNQSRMDAKAPSALFHNERGQFFDNSPKTGLEIGKTANDAFAILSNIRDSLPMELMIFGSEPPGYLPRAFQINKGKFHEITGSIFSNEITNVFDAVTADFNGDLQADIFLSRYKYASNIVKIDDDSYRAGIFNTGALKRGLDFVTSGDLKLSIHLPSIKWGFSNVFVGRNLVSMKPVNKKKLSGDILLSTSDENVLGEPQITETRKRGVYIWYEPKTSSWHIRFTSETWAFLQLEIVGSEIIQNVKPYGFESNSPLQPVALFSSKSGYKEKFLGKFPSCPSAAAADFDNDMDVDLYLVCTESVANRHNQLYENQGNGKFRKVSTHGAEGTKVGIGNKAMIADYNNDGFPDIFIINGLGVVSPINQGPYQLFKNTGNNNHWLKIKLSGTKSNRDGVGAEVLVKAGGKTQLREQNGKSHYGAQDDIVLHFGLGTNLSADEITIRWPSGITQRLYDVKADQTLSITERNTDGQ